MLLKFGVYVEIEVDAQSSPPFISGAKKLQSQIGFVIFCGHKTTIYGEGCHRPPCLLLLSYNLHQKRFVFGRIGLFVCPQDYLQSIDEWICMKFLTKVCLEPRNNPLNFVLSVLLSGLRCGGSQSLTDCSLTIYLYCLENFANHEMGMYIYFWSIIDAWDV